MIAEQRERAWREVWVRTHITDRSTSDELDRDDAERAAGEGDSHDS
jgi:hypothetical protein